MAATAPPVGVVAPWGTAKANAAGPSFRGAMPKEETGASAFLAAHPEYDGRGIVVAIFDSGVDPGAAGLQTTPQGEPKVIDVVDCSGSGDVDTSQVVKADGLTLPPINGGMGRSLKVNPAWKNPSGDWHVGAIRAYRLFPGGAIRKSKEGRARAWAAKQRAAISTATAAVATHSRMNPDPLDGDLKKERAELEARVKLLEELEGAREDLGPLIECVVWHDGTTWRAALDTSDMYQIDAEGEVGDSDATDVSKGLLADFEPLASYAEERKYGTFSSMDAVNFAINVYDEGCTLSIVVDAGSHGTHVAGITAAYYPEDPDLNGVAPGAQIISCKIGDTRLGTMETHTGLTRALIHTIAAKADLINMSYGESTSAPDVGRFMQMAADVVNKHGVIFVSSAGNRGPALSTVGAPGGTSSAIISVGAYVSTDLAAAGHSIREETDGQQYTWSSRGPTADGHLGVTLSAPGGAVAPVPTWTRQRRQLMNGTSIASPNACGCIALLLSGIKAEGLPNTPAIVRRALENSCLSVRPGEVDNYLTYGRGLIQVDKAWEMLNASAAVDLPSFWYDIKCRLAGTQSWQRGVYLREPGEAAGTVNVTVDATPQLHEDADVTSERLVVEHKLMLRSTAPWISCPDLLLVHHGGRTFEMSLACGALADGLHFAEVEALDSEALWRGPIFRVPVTVVKPTACGPPPPSASTTLPRTRLEPPIPPHVALFPSLAFTAGREHRHFVAVPEGATWCEMKLTSASDGCTNPRGYIVRATQLRPAQSFSDNEGVRAFLQLGAGQDWNRAFPVYGGGTLELTIAQFWSSLGDSSLDCSLDFHGLSVALSGLPRAVLQPGGPVRIEARSALRREKIAPKAFLRELEFTLRPVDAKLDTLATPRDTFTENRVVHRLTLTYKLSSPEPGKYAPALPGLTSLVYDASYELAPLMLFDSNKQLIASWDPSDPSPAKVKKKAEHTVRVVIRHDSPALLEKLRSLPLVMQRTLETSISVPVYGSNAEAVTGGKTMDGPLPLLDGASKALFVGPVPEDKMPKDAGPGKTLVGSLLLGKCAYNGGKASPGAMPLALPCPAAKEDKKNADMPKKDDGDSKSPADKFREAMRDAKIKFLKDLKTDADDAKELYDTMRKELLLDFPGYLPVLLEHMNRLNSVEGDKRTLEALRLIIQAAEVVVSVVDIPALAAHVARKCMDEDESQEAVATRALLNAQKAALIEALACKCTALLDIEEAEAKDAVEHGSQESAPETESEARDGSSTFKETFADLRCWVDTSTDTKHVMLHSRAEERAGRLAVAYKVLDKIADPQDKAPNLTVADRRIALLSRLGWSHWAAHMKSRKVDVFPASLPPI